ELGYLLCAIARVVVLGMRRSAAATVDRVVPGDVRRADPGEQDDVVVPARKILAQSVRRVVSDELDADVLQLRLHRLEGQLAELVTGAPLELEGSLRSVARPDAAGTRSRGAAGASGRLHERNGLLRVVRVALPVPLVVLVARQDDRVVQGRKTRRDVGLRV